MSKNHIWSAEEKSSLVNLMENKVELEALQMVEDGKFTIKSIMSAGYRHHGYGSRVLPNGNHILLPSIRYEQPNRGKKADLSLAQAEVIEPSLITHDGKVFATSKNVAEVFGKDHDKVVKIIENMNERAIANFGGCSYVGENGRDYNMYEMNRDGWMFLVMGFTGSDADDMKMNFIEAFNKMESALRAQPIVSKTGNPVIDAMNEVYEIGSEALERANTAFGVANVIKDDLEGVKSQMNFLSEELLYLNPRQLAEIEKAKKHAAMKFADLYDMNVSDTMRAYGKALNNHFKVNSYKSIKHIDFDEALTFICTYQPTINVA